MISAKEIAENLAIALNNASPEAPYGWTARAWQPEGKGWARVYCRANSRSARELGHFSVQADGSVDYLGKMKKDLKRAARSCGFGPEDWA